MSLIITIVVLVPMVYDVVSYLLKSETGVHLSGEVLEIVDVSNSDGSVTKIYVAYEYRGKKRNGMIRIPFNNATAISRLVRYNTIDLIYVPLTRKVFAAGIPDELDWKHCVWCLLLLTIALLGGMFY